MLGLCLILYFGSYCGEYGLPVALSAGRVTFVCFGLVTRKPAAFRMARAHWKKGDRIAIEHRPRTVPFSDQTWTRWGCWFPEVPTIGSRDKPGVCGGVRPC